MEPMVGSAGAAVLDLADERARRFHRGVERIDFELDFARASSELAVMAAQIAALRKFRDKK